MIDVDALTKAIRTDSAAMYEWRQKMDEKSRPKDLAGLQDMLCGIRVFVEKNDHYQREMDGLRHAENARQRGRGDDLVRPAWEAKTMTKTVPWAFNTNFRELIKIFLRGFSPLIAKLTTDLTHVARAIEKGLVAAPSDEQIESIRKEMGRITATFQWLRDNGQVNFLDQVDSSGREALSHEGLPPGLPDAMDQFEELLTKASNRQNQLEEKWRATDSHRLAIRSFWVSIIAVIISALTFVLAIGPQFLKLL